MCVRFIECVCVSSVCKYINTDNKHEKEKNNLIHSRSSYNFNLTTTKASSYKKLLVNKTNN